MKIIVATIGSRGDVQPYINLSQELQAAGHDVTLATNPTLCGLAAAHGVKSAPVGPPVDMGLEGERLMARSFNNMWIGMIRVMQLGARLVEQAYPDVLELCRDADLVVTSDTGSGVAEAGRLGKPWLSCTLQPGRIPTPQENVSAVQRAVWGVLGKLFVAPTNRFRRRVGAPLVENISTMLSDRLILLPVSRHVAPPDPRWPAHVFPTGYWFARPEPGWRPPADLQDFLDAGERPVVVSLGVMSLSGKQAVEAARVTLGALRAVGLRAVAQGWDPALRQLDPDAPVYFAGSLPHDWLFAQARAVVHHGGFGTTAAALRAGAPAVVVPHVIDQFYWGQRVHELGVGPAPVSRGKLTVERLAEALQQAVTRADLRDQAAALGAAIRAEPDGARAAVERIEQGI